MILYEQLGRRSALRRSAADGCRLTELRAAFCIIALGHFLCGGEGGELSREPGPAGLGCPQVRRGLGVTQVSVPASEDELSSGPAALPEVDFSGIYAAQSP